MVYIVAASSFYHNLEQLSNLEKEQFLPKTLAIPGLSLSPNNTNPQKNLASLLCRAPLAEKRQVVVWHGIINNSISSHGTNNYRACTAEKLTEILKRYCILSEKQYARYEKPADQLGYSCHSYYDVSHFKEEEKNGADQRISGTPLIFPAGAKIFAACVRTPRQSASCFVQASFKHEKEISSEKAGGEKKTGEQRQDTVGPTDEGAST